MVETYRIHRTFTNYRFTTSQIYLKEAGSILWGDDVLDTYTSSKNAYKYYPSRAASYVESVYDCKRITMSQYLSYVTQMEIFGSVETILGADDSSDYGYYWSGLESLIIHEGPTVIAAGAFRKNILTSIEFPSTIQYIRQDAFSNSSNLKEISFGPSILNIGRNAFVNSPITDVYFDGTPAQWEETKTRIDATNTNILTASIHFVIPTENVKLLDKENESHDYVGIDSISILGTDGLEKIFSVIQPAEPVYADIVLKYPNNHERVYEHISQITVPTADGNTATFYLQP